MDTEATRDNVSGGNGGPSTTEAALDDDNDDDTDAGGGGGRTPAADLLSITGCSGAPKACRIMVVTVVPNAKSNIKII